MLRVCKKIKQKEQNYPGDQGKKEEYQAGTEEDLRKLDNDAQNMDHWRRGQGSQGCSAEKK